MTKHPKTTTITLDEYELDELRDCLAQVMDTTAARRDDLSPFTEYVMYGGARYDEGVIAACDGFIQRFDALLKEMHADD